MSRSSTYVCRFADHCLAAAATNGELCVWNLSKGGKAVQEQVYYEHKRTVNKINFHATEPNKLISCCQDGTIRYFDVRCKSSVAIFIRYVFCLLVQSFFAVHTE